jgi:hypothetical protein
MGWQEVFVPGKSSNYRAGLNRCQQTWFRDPTQPFSWMTQFSLFDLILFQFRPLIAADFCLD